jgi:hypothetical protein
MSTKSNRSSGTQHNQRGVTQGTTLVGKKSGLPIDEVVDQNGVRRLAVDSTVNVTLPTNIDVNLDGLGPTGDNVYLIDNVTGNKLKINTDGSIDSNVEIDAADGDNIAISDGVNDLLINPDGSINANINPSTTPIITNQIATLANTEYSYTFPMNTKKFSLRTRGNAKIQLAFVSLQSGTNFITISPGNSYEEKDLKLVSVTAYFQLNKAGETVEILSWT